MFQDNTLRLSTYIYRFWLRVIAATFILVATGCGGLVNHKVEPGDSLYSIGFYYGQDYRDIAEWNNIAEPYIIYNGQWLRVAPPDLSWSEERKKQNKQQKTVSETVKNAKNAKDEAKKAEQRRLATQPEKAVKQVIAEDFTDKSGNINSWVWPTKGRLLNADKKFSQRNKGIDISGKRGQPVYATAEGKVVYSGSGLIGYGKLIIIKHNKTYLSAYAHNEKILVKEGDVVMRGQKVAQMGPTPDNHIQLHFEIRQNGKPVDPLRFLKR